MHRRHRHAALNKAVNGLNSKITTMTFCRECEKSLPFSAAACFHCGARQNHTRTVPRQPPVSRKNQITVGLLALLLGSLGFHKFYLGAWGWGLVYVALCWTWVPTVAGLVEGIRYLTLRKATFQRKAVQLRGSFSFLW